MSDDTLPHRFVERVDETPDPLFYEQPRFVAHIDDATIDALTTFYRERITPGADVLDLMSSWISHLPAEAAYGRVAGLGMNEPELAANEQLTERVVHDLNDIPALPYADASFDFVLNTVSVQYLTQPVEVFREVRRVLRPGGWHFVALSHRTFPTKCVALFRSLPPHERPGIVARYASLAGGFEPAARIDRSPPPAAGVFPDPLWVVALERSA